MTWLRWCSSKLERVEHSVFTFALIRRVIGIAIFGAVLACLVLAVQEVPEWQASRVGVRSITANPELKTIPAEVAALQNDMRKTFIQVLGGAFALVALYFTYRRVRVTEQGHITDRYTRAIEQLGAMTATNSPNVEVRLGAIYALERIAIDSPRDHGTIMEVLTAYVRENAPISVLTLSEDENRRAIEKGPATEIQAILTVLGRRRRGRWHDHEGHLDLRSSDLRGANFWGTHMEGALFSGANLEGAQFYRANLEDAHFLRANLKDAYFLGAYAQGVHFEVASVEGATFDHARLEGADFTLANARRASFRCARLEATDFSEANVEGANFTDSDIRNALALHAASLSAKQIDSAQEDGAADSDGGSYSI
jgi:hypothetical protein